MNSPQQRHEVRLRGLYGLILCAILLLVAGMVAPAGVRAQDTVAVEATEPDSRCMELHLREAAALNKERMPLYDSLSGGRSRGISRRLIWTERLALAAAWYVDWRARAFQREGIRIVCDDFVPMANTPAFQPRAADPPPPLSAFVPADARRIRRAVERARRRGGFPAASTVLEQEIETLNQTPAYHCMLRHLLESALRISNQAPLYVAEAERRGLSASPAELSRTMLDLHLVPLGEAARLDARAAPLQAESIPIICQDVPPIPPLAH